MVSMKWEDFIKRLNLTDEERREIDSVKNTINPFDLSQKLTTLINNLKQKYEMKETSVEILKNEIKEEIQRYKEEYQNIGYDIGYTDGYSDGINSKRIRK